MKTKLLLLLLLPLLMGASCKKDKDDGLTKPTQIGANTFSCKINGENFIASQSLFGPTAIFVSNVQSSTPYFLLDGRNTNSQPYKEIELKIFEDVRVGVVYKLGGGEQNYGSITYRYPDDLYKTSINSIGEVMFTRVDNTNKIYSGTFSFLCVNSINQQIKITNGRFDVKIQ
ncbi:hypothetical protein GM921_13025 [Pedobacter sp. LMG 31464]|uniref:Lipoprotein n=1 Tax=Pedobacter planticolens TaxID=2679964 RepID=A0A923DYI9_9SPHI|nr:DUF6252 family protein [Pedobacter planticolens]MBB2146417.1 hypothetical protein [Pedobacter planticolens]